MIIRRYRGKSLEALRETVVKEMGNNAVIIHSQKLNEGGIVNKLKGSGYEIIAAIEEPIKEGSLSSGKDLNVDEIMSSQKSHYLGIRRSMKMLDEKLASLDTRFEEMMKKKLKDDEMVLMNLIMSTKDGTRKSSQEFLNLTTPLQKTSKKP